MTTQLQRIVWRQRMMAIGAVDYLHKFWILFGRKERLTCPSIIGLPHRLRMLMWRHEKEHPATIRELGSHREPAE
jgi:hypothetical protein